MTRATKGSDCRRSWHVAALRPEMLPASARAQRLQPRTGAVPTPAAAPGIRAAPCAHVQCSPWCQGLRAQPLALPQSFSSRGNSQAVLLLGEPGDWSPPIHHGVISTSHALLAALGQHRGPYSNVVWELTMPASLARAVNTPCCCSSTSGLSNSAIRPACSTSTLRASGDRGWGCGSGSHAGPGAPSCQKGCIVSRGCNPVLRATVPEQRLCALLMGKACPVTAPPSQQTPLPRGGGLLSYPQHLWAGQLHAIMQGCCWLQPLPTCSCYLQWCTWCMHGPCPHLGARGVHIATLTGAGYRGVSSASLAPGWLWGCRQPPAHTCCCP